MASEQPDVEKITTIDSCLVSQTEITSSSGENPRTMSSSSIAAHPDVAIPISQISNAKTKPNDVAPSSPPSLPDEDEAEEEEFAGICGLICFIITLCINLVIVVIGLCVGAVMVVGGLCVLVGVGALLCAFLVFGFVAITLFLLISLLVTRLVQFIRHGDDYYKATQLRFLIQFYMYGASLIALPLLGIFTFVFYAAIKHATISGLLLTNWIRITCMICGFCILSCLLHLVCVHLVPRLPLEHSESGINVRAAVSEIFDCLIIWWAASSVIHNVPALKLLQILGLPVRKWIEVSIFVLMAYDTITVFTHLFAYFIRKVCQRSSEANPTSIWYLLVENVLHRYYLVYYAIGIKRNIDFIFSSLILLLTWVLYFGSRLNATTGAKHVLDFGTWTCLSLMILAFLWLIKTCVLLVWEAHQVYNRLNHRIFHTGEQLYFLGIIGRHKYDIFNLRYEQKIQDHEQREKDEEHEGNPQEEETDILPRRSLLFTLVKIWSEARTIYDKSMVIYLLTNFFSPHSIFAGSYKDEDDGVVNREGNPPLMIKLSSKMKNRVKDDLLIHKRRHHSRKPTIYQIQQMAQCFLAAKQALSIETYTSDILDFLKSKISIADDDTSVSPNDQTSNIPSANDTTDNISAGHSCTSPELELQVEKLKQLIDGGADHSSESQRDEHDSENFEELLNVSWSRMSFDDVENWLESAHSNCLSLANTLGSAKEVVDCLNKIISGLLIGATFIIWLLLAGLASTKVFVLIASPLLAATFIFGDTCKTLFQGIMFVYVLHPFNIGDICVIEDKMMEVKTVGVWKTTFVKFGTREELICPNSELANKMVINHKTEIDYNDNMVFDLGSLDDEEINFVTSKIENYLNEEDNQRWLSSHSVEVLATEDKTEIAVYIKHNKSKLQNWTFSECHKQKKKLRSQFCRHIRNLVKEQVKAKEGAETPSY